MSKPTETEVARVLRSVIRRIEAATEDHVNDRAGFALFDNIEDTLRQLAEHLDPPETIDTEMRQRFERSILLTDAPLRRDLEPPTAVDREALWQKKAP